MNNILPSPKTLIEHKKSMVGIGNNLIFLVNLGKKTKITKIFILFLFQNQG